MSGDLLEFGSGPVYERIQHFAERARHLPPESRELVDEVLEAFTISVKEMQVIAEELNQQNAELVSAQEEIERQRQRYRDMFEFAPDGYIMTDSEGMIREANKAAVALLGLPKTEFSKKPMLLFVAPAERQRFLDRLHRLAHREQAGADEVEWEMRFNSRQGREFPAALTVAPIKDADGKLTGLRWLLRDVSESKRVEERERLLAQVREQYQSAQEANRLLHAFIDTMPVGAIIADGDGMFLLTNTVGREILGKPVGGNLEAPQIDFNTYYPDGVPFPREKMPLMRAIHEKQSIKDVEVLVQRADGEKRTLLSSAAPILDDDRNVLSGITIFQDITERKQTRLALRRYAQRLEVLRQADRIILSAGSLDDLVESLLLFVRDVMTCQAVSVLAFDLETNKVFPLGSLSAGEIQSRRWEQSIPLTEIWPLEELSSKDMLVSQKLLRFDGGLIPVEELKAQGVRYIVNVSLVAEDELLGILNLGYNEKPDLDDKQREIISQVAGELAIGIRQMRLREQLQRHAAHLERMVARRTAALRESEQRFRIILEAAVFGIALLDTKGRIVLSNPAMQKMTGYEETELEGMTFSDYSHPDDEKADEELYRALASLETGHFQTEKRYVRKDGQVRWSELTVSRVKRTDSGKLWLAVAIMEDITEKKKIQETLVRAERLAIAGRLGASLAHEINNPVQAVIGCLGLAEEMLEDNPDVNRYLEIAMQELERAADIVTQLRDLGRSSEPKEKEPTDLNAFIERVLLLTRKRCQNQGVEVEWNPAESLPPVPLSKERMQQVLLNIVLNAIEAMPEGGRLHLSTTSLTGRHRGVNIIIADNGVGIERERLAHIFEPFHSSRPDGLGLGLFISRNIVEEHGGRIEVESRIGEGSTFTLWLPVK